VTVTKPVEFGSGQTVDVAVELERATLARDNPRNPSVDLTRDKDKPDKDKPDKPDKDKPDKDVKPDKPEFGFLAVGSKPPCRIFINGRDTGMRTPRKGIKLKAGRHKITLVNNTHGINERFSVTIKPGQTTRRIRDWSDRIK